MIFKKSSLFILLGICLPYIASFSPGKIRDSYSLSKKVLDNKGQLLRLTLAGDDQYRLWTDQKDYPEEIKKAFLLKEDQYFYYHPGFNPISLIRAFVQTLFLKKSRSGASTLTMQLARLHYKLKTKSLVGKLKQIALAYWLELLYSKTEIMTAYLNLTPYGRNIVGFETAARVYFQKPLKKLVLPEILFLVSVPQSPGLLNQHLSFSAAPKKLEEKMRQTFSRWPNKAVKDQNTHIMGLTIHLYGLKDLPFEAPHFADFILNKKTEQRSFQTSLELEKQKIIESNIKEFILKRKDLKNASAMLLDYRSMEVKAMVGSKDFFNANIFGQFNGTLALRSPGSTLKPFLYALAMEQGHVIPQSIVFDAPLSFRTPENFDGRFKGPISVEKSLILSRNVPAVYLASLLKTPNFHEFLYSLFPKRVKKKNIYGSSLSLGGIEFTMMDLVQLYASLGNRGEFSDVRWLKTQPYSEGEQILSAEAVTMVMDILSRNQRPGHGSASRYMVKDVEVFWKTGTSFGFRDAWSVGIFGPYVLAVWVGNFSGPGHPSFVGSTAAAPLFFEMVDRLKHHIPSDFNQLHNYHQNLTMVKVCALSGYLPNKNCTHQKESLFIPGVSPIKKCKIHRKIHLSKATGQRACLKTKGEFEEKVIEVWPTHILKIFENAGLPRKLPPSYGPECKRADIAKEGHPPDIITPRKGLKYTFRLNKKKNTLALKAKADADVEYLHWYVQDQYIGKAKPKETIYWPARPGKFLVRAIDSFGRQTQRNLTVLFLAD